MSPLRQNQAGSVLPQQHKLPDDGRTIYTKLILREEEYGLTILNLSSNLRKKFQVLSNMFVIRKYIHSVCFFL